MAGSGHDGGGTLRAPRPPQAAAALRPAARGGRGAAQLGGAQGPADDPGHDRLAIAVDDHGLDHATYEDEHKTIADDGTWEEHDRTGRRLLFSLHGRHGVRRYALIHTGGSQWLLHLTQGAARDGPLTGSPGGTGRMGRCSTAIPS